MKLPEIKKPDIKLPDFKKLELKMPQLKRSEDDEIESEKRSFKMPEFKKPDIKMPKLDFKLTEGTMMKAWTGGSIVCIACSGIALIVALF